MIFRLHDADAETAVQQGAVVRFLITVCGTLKPSLLVSVLRFASQIVADCLSPCQQTNYISLPVIRVMFS